MSAHVPKLTVGYYQLNGVMREIVEAYQVATGRDVRIDHMRAYTLGAIVARGFTGDDVRLVVGYILKKKARAEMAGQPGFTERALEFSRLFSDPDRFEELCESARTFALGGKRRGRPRRLIAKERTIDAAGNTMTVLDAAPLGETHATREIVAKSLRDLAKQILKGEA